MRLTSVAVRSEHLELRMDDNVANPFTWLKARDDATQLDSGLWLEARVASTNYGKELWSI